MALAASMGEPPPMEMIQSGSNSRMTAAPLITVSTEGSGSTFSIRRVSMPASFRYPRALSTKPNFFMEPPPSTSTAREPFRFFRFSSALAP